MISYHPRAKTNIHLRRIICGSPESSRVLAAKFHLNPKTILKWKQRTILTDFPCGAKTRHCRLIPLQRRIIATVRKHLKLNLDDLVVVLKPYIPHLNRDNCYRVLVAIDRITKVVFLMLVNGKTQIEAVRFLKTVIAFYPYRIHRILTDNGKEFGKQFTVACRLYGIKHKRTKIKHPWTNGQAEITVKLIKQDTVWQRFYRDYLEIEIDLRSWQTEYNCKRRLKSLKGLTPYEKTLEYYQGLTEEKRRQRFKRHPEILLNSAPLHGAT